MSHTADELKHEAALRAVKYVRDGMVLGLGSGTTAEHAVKEIGRRVQEDGLRVRGVPTSDKIGTLAVESGIHLTSLEQDPQIDLTIDGADEVDLKTLNAIKGLGGALLREKIVALASREEILIVDESKVVRRLGEHTPVPVEVVQFGWSRTRDELQKLDCIATRRESPTGAPFVTDSGNYLIDCKFPYVKNPQRLSDNIIRITGVIEHGLFLNIARRIIIASEAGVRVVERKT
ncbi:MAG: ribose 5-phosphate isomerase A [Chloroflexota bacterium]